MSCFFRECRSAFSVVVSNFVVGMLLVSPVNAQEFQLIVGGTDGDIRWPAAEAPEFAIDWEGQKYLNFAREHTGFYVRPEGDNASDTATSITFWTANDAVPRDPASYQLFGSNSSDLFPPLDYLPQDEVPFDLFTEISSGELDLPESRNEGGAAELDDFNSQTVEFDNTTQYESYLVLFPTVKDSGAANSMQIAEVQLNYDGFDLDSGIFDFQDEIVGVGLNEIAAPLELAPLVLDDFKLVVGGTEPPHQWPGAEGPENTINWEGQKYLNFTRENTGILIQPEGPNADNAATSITLWAANDAEPRDPSSFRILGSNDSDLLSPVDYAHRDEILLDSFTEIAFGSVELPSSRNDGGAADLDDGNSQTIEFENAAAFDNYVVLFPTVKDGDNANSMQIAEIQLNYDGQDIDSGVFDFEDAVTGVALANIETMVDPGPTPPEPAEPIQPINVRNFEIVVGSTEDPVRWPDNEGPENAINGEGQKYLNFEKENTGIMVLAEGDNADEAATSITIWAANDAVPRDPASFRLFGSNNDELDSPLDYEHEETIPLDLFTEIAIGDMELSDSRNDGGDAELDDANSQTFEFENEETFDTYLVVFPTLKDSDNANSMQIAEIQLNYDGFDIDSGIFDVFDEITGIALFELEGVCDPDTMGDLDGDGMVAFSDFLILADNFSQDATSHEEGDFDCNGVVEFADFLILSTNFGQAVGAEASSVPEPNAAAMAIVALLGSLSLRRRS